MERDADRDGADGREGAPTSPLRVEVTRDAHATVVVVAGEVDMWSSERMREAMFAELRIRPELLVVDLAGVEFSRPRGSPPSHCSNAQRVRPGSRCGSSRTRAASCGLCRSPS